MTAIAIKQFGGISPKVPPRYLADTQAQVALDCFVFNGSLQPLLAPGTTVYTLPKAGVPKTIYRFGQDLISDTQYWFHWTTDVDVCRSQISGDTSEWTFFTDGVQPRATYAALALTGGTQYPMVSRPLGLPAPATAATVAVFGTAEVGSASESRVYTYTQVCKESGFEFESAPATASVTVEVSAGQSATVSGFATTPAGYVVTHRRIYRSVLGTYLFVAELPVALVSYVDSTDAESLGEELPSTTWAQPPAAMRGLTNLPNGIMAGFLGRDVYFCEPYRPHAWPLQYMQSVDFPVVGLGRMDTTLAVLTTGTPYLIQGSQPDSMVVVKSDLEQACASKRSIVSLNGVVLYASPDGLVMLSSNGSKLVTESYFTRLQWQAYFKPDSIVGFSHDLKYVGFYNNGTTSGGFIYDLTTGQLTTHSVYATAGYSDLVNDKLFLAFSDRSVKVWQAGQGSSFSWKSKKFTLPRPTGFAAAQLEAEVYPMTVNFYCDGASTPAFTQSVTSRSPFRLPPLVARDWEVQVSGSHEVFSFAVAQSIEELKSV